MVLLSLRHTLLALALCAAGLPARAAAQVQAAAPDFTLRSTQGPALQLHELRGQVVLVNFWASWCAPCRQEMPHLSQLYDKYRSAGFALLAVNIDDDAQHGADTAARWGLRFPVLLDSDKRVTRLYDLGSMPASVLISRDGRVRHLHRGYREGMEKIYEQQLRQLLKE